MNKACNHFRRMMQVALDGELRAGEKAAFEQHLAGCRACGMAFRAFQLSLDLMRALPVPEASPDFASEILKQARAAKQGQARQQRYLSWVMALVILLASAGMVVGWSETVQPAIGRMIEAVLSGCLELWSLLSGLLNAAAVLVSTFLTLISAVLPIPGQGWGLFFTEFGMGLSIMLALAFMPKIRRARAGTMVFSL